MKKEEEGYYDREQVGLRQPPTMGRQILGGEVVGTHLGELPNQLVSRMSSLEDIMQNASGLLPSPGWMMAKYHRAVFSTGLTRSRRAPPPQDCYLRPDQSLDESRSLRSSRPSLLCPLPSCELANGRYCIVKAPKRSGHCS
jgi:hypothetical protein